MTLFPDMTEEQKEAAKAYARWSEREAAKVPGLTGNLKLRRIDKAAVIGAGTMGGGIAMAFAAIGIPVRLIDANPDALRKQLAVIERNLAFSVSRGRLEQAEMDQRLGLIVGDMDLSNIAQADIVVEAVPELLELKQEVFKALDKVAKPGAILATNTSGLDIDKIATTTGRPGDVVGAHFFAPANVMRLLEVVRGEYTALDVIATLMDLGRHMGKVSVLARIYPGFIGNAMLAHYSREATFLVEDGATPGQVDKALTDFGFAMGKFTVGDMAGNDVGIDKVRQDAATRNPRLRYPDLRIEMCDRGRLGQKTGVGWYKYEPGDRTPHDDPDLESIIDGYRAKVGIVPRTISTDEILERCLLGVINEGARLVELGIALRPSDVDAVFVTGYGFPAWRGGPLYMADQIGLGRVVERIKAYQAPNSPWWEITPLLEKLARTGSKFAELQA